MNKKIRWFSNERVDLPDASALHDETDAALRSRTRALLNSEGDGACLVSGFSCAVNPDDDTQVLITPGVAILVETLADDTLSPGQLLDMTGEDAAIVELSGLDVNDYGIYLAFIYRDGETRNRAKWRPDLDPEREEVTLANTRQLAGIQVQVSVNSPGAAWHRVALAHWDGGLIAADLQDTRVLFFEGTGSGGFNPATTWSWPTFSRSDSRAVNGVRSLRQWVIGVAGRLMEIAGRTKWYQGPVFGENLRSASTQVSVRVGGGDAVTAHYTLDNASPVTNRVTLQLMSASVNYLAGGDPRTDVVFVPDVATGTPAAVEVDCALSIVCTGSGVGVRRRFSGAATFKRVSGGADLFATSAGGTGYHAIYEGMTFSATTGAGALYRLRSPTDRVTFVDCVFDGSLAATFSTLVKIEAACSVDFIRCRFLCHSSQGQTAILKSAEATVCLDHCTFIGGLYNVDIAGSPFTPGLTLLRSCAFVGGVTAVRGNTQIGLVIDGGLYGTTGNAVVAPALTLSAAAAASRYGGGLLTGLVSGSALESRGGTVFFGSNADQTITHDGRTVSGMGENGVAIDMLVSRLRASGGIVAFTDDYAGPRLRRSNDTTVQFSDDLNDSYLRGHMQATEFVLGTSRDEALARMNRNLPTKMWGVIKMLPAWGAEAAQDRALHATGYYQSRTVRGDSDPLVVRGYSFLSGFTSYPPDGFPDPGDSGRSFDAHALVADPDTDHRECVIFKVSGLGLTDDMYSVVGSAMGGGANSTIFEGTNDNGIVDFTYGAGQGTIGPSANPTYSVRFFKPTLDSFYLAVIKHTGRAPDRLMTFADIQTSLMVSFVVHSVCDNAAFVNGGAG